jgi:Gpi18-like mannosyltransferase
MNNEPQNATEAQTMGRTRITSPAFWVIAAALVALALKLCIALNTEGTNDVVFFYQFANDLAQHGLEWTYRHQPKFNHPPLVSYFLRGICSLGYTRAFQENGLKFPFLLRLPGIIADFVVVLLLLRLRKQWALSTGSLLLLALSPVSIMVSGFHGNTDPVLVLFMVLAAYLCARNQPTWCGAVLALSCGIKIVPVLLLPVFFWFWYSRQRTMRFLFPFIVTVIAISIQPLLSFPLPFARNVFAYSGYWGLWGITYWLRLTGWLQFVIIDYPNVTLAENIVSNALKLIIVVAALMIAWRRRATDSRGLFGSVAYVWLVFFAFAPGVGPQYLVWAMPFLLVFPPAVFAYITAACSLFIFFFYNTIAAGLPWNLAASKNEIIDQWAPWAIWPWLTFVAALIVAWQQTKRRNPSVRLLSLESVDDSDALQTKVAVPLRSDRTTRP